MKRHAVGLPASVEMYRIGMAAKAMAGKARDNTFVRAIRGVVKEIFMLEHLGLQPELPAELPGFNTVRAVVDYYHVLNQQLCNKLVSKITETKATTGTPAPDQPISAPVKPAFPKPTDPTSSDPAVSYTDYPAAIILAKLMEQVHRLDYEDIDGQLKALMRSLREAVQGHDPVAAAGYLLLAHFVTMDERAPLQAGNAAGVPLSTECDADVENAYNYFHWLCTRPGTPFTHRGWLNYGFVYSDIWELKNTVTHQELYEQYKKVDSKLCMPGILTDEKIIEKEVRSAACLRLAMIQFLGRLSAQNTYPMIKRSNLPANICEIADEMDAVHDFVTSQREELTVLGPAPEMKVEGMKY